MSTFNTLVAAGAGVVGWLVVSYLLDRAKKNRPDDELSPPPPARATQTPVTRPSVPAALPVPVKDAPGAAGPVSLDEIGQSWHTILGVSVEARAGEIERAYYDKLTDLDRARFAADATPETRQRVESQKALLTQAYEFIRPLRP
jgi:hypothetical protein